MSDRIFIYFTSTGSSAEALVSLKGMWIEKKCISSFLAL